jgi:hypothetical protein
VSSQPLDQPVRSVHLVQALGNDLERFGLRPPSDWDSSSKITSFYGTDHLDQRIKEWAEAEAALVSERRALDRLVANDQKLRNREEILKAWGEEPPANEAPEPNRWGGRR